MLPRDVWNVQDTKRIDGSDPDVRRKKLRRVRLVHFTCAPPVRPPKPHAAFSPSPYRVLHCTFQACTDVHRTEVIRLPVLHRLWEANAVEAAERDEEQGGNVLRNPPAVAADEQGAEP